MAGAAPGTWAATADNGPPAPAVTVSVATGEPANSPGVLSGNVILVPLHVPVNACVDVGLLNPASGSSCAPQ
nr:chaplin [Streptomyces klenkii]